MIFAENIKKSFNKNFVLKGIDLQIKKKEIVAIVGQSGAGKTTLIQILSTLDKPDDMKTCQLKINGISPLLLNDKEISKFRNLHIGFVFQFHQLLPEFTALENVSIPAFIKNENKKSTKKKALDLLNFLEIKHKSESKPHQLSGGEQQRVAIARALINEPSIVFADEPSGNLDSKNAALLHKLFFKLREEFDQTFVIVTHNKKLAIMADKKITIQDGKLIN